MDDAFRVNLYRKKADRGPVISGDVGENVGDVGENVGEKIIDEGDLKAKIINLINDNNKASASEIAQKLLIAQRTVERHIKELRESGRLIRHGSARGGYWEVK